MKKLFAIVTLLLAVTLFASSGKELANKLGISAASKASSQWNRVFKKTRKMKKYGIDKLSDADKSTLKTYLVDHAADSDAPEAAGM
jgi:ABC-type metal ion transport system substrate-binding protein